MSAPSLVNCHLGEDKVLFSWCHQRFGAHFNPQGSIINKCAPNVAVWPNLPTVPQEAAGCFHVILQLIHGTPADGHAVVVLNLHRVLDIVGLWHCASVFDLERDLWLFRERRASAHALPSFLSPWFCSESLHPGQSGSLRTPLEADPGRCESSTPPASYLQAKISARAEGSRRTVLWLTS